MSQPRLPPTQRKHIIKQYVSQEGQDAIAQRCGVTRRTIIRDIALMKVTGEWWDFLEYALLRFLHADTVPDTVKFNKIADLYAKQFVTSKVDATSTEAKHYTFQWIPPRPRDRIPTTHRPDLIP